MPPYGTQCRNVSNGHHDYTRALQALHQAYDGERVCRSGEGTSPYVLTSRAAGREATRETAELCLLHVLILACWALTVKYYSGLLSE